MTDKCRTYSGGAFHSSLPKGRASGNVQVTYSDIEFSYDEIALRLPCDGLRLRWGGAADRSVFFDHPEVEDLTIYCSEERILDHPIFRKRLHLARQVQVLRSRKWKKTLLVVVFLAILVAIPIGLFSLREPFVIAVTKRIPVDWEVEFGEVVFQQLVSERQLLQDEMIHEQLQTITEPILNAIPDGRYNFRFHIVQDSQVNALAIPGGNVVIFSGLLMKADSPEEIAGVLAHEISHVTLQHSLRQVIGTTGVYLLVQTLFGDSSGLLAVIAESGTFLLTRKFSRQYEQEADELGWRYLANANINPKGLVSFFEKLKAVEDSKHDVSPEKILNGSLNFLSTHPATDDRIHHLNEKLKHLPPSTSFITFRLDFPQFQKKLRSLVHSGKEKQQIAPK